MAAFLDVPVQGDGRHDSVDERESLLDSVEVAKYVAIHVDVEHVSGEVVDCEVHRAEELLKLVPLFAARVRVGLEVQRVGVAAGLGSHEVEPSLNLAFFCRVSHLMERSVLVLGSPMMTHQPSSRFVGK